MPSEPVPPVDEPAFAAGLRDALCDWFAEHRRDLPWRRSRDPYAVWISEAMLQQTRVETVVPYWERFLERLPTVEDLAAVSEDELLALWSGLGYYRRARSLREAAIRIRDDHGGRFPDLVEDALALPGVGPYTAGAVLSIAYDLPEAAVDGNVVRVFSRLFELREPWGSSALTRRTWDLARRLLAAIPPGGGARGPGAWTQALMELGATVCTTRKPACSECPVRTACRARELDQTHALPVPGAKREPLNVELEVLLVRTGDALLLVRRPPGGRMAGLWECPTRELPESGVEREPRLYPRAYGIEELDRARERAPELARVRHSITRHRIVAVVRSLTLEGVEPPERGRWTPVGELAGLGLTGMTAKLLATDPVRVELFGLANR